MGIIQHIAGLVAGIFFTIGIMAAAVLSASVVILGTIYLITFILRGLP